MIKQIAKPSSLDYGGMDAGYFKLAHNNNNITARTQRTQIVGSLRTYIYIRYILNTPLGTFVNNRLITRNAFGNFYTNMYTQLKYINRVNEAA